MTVSLPRVPDRGAGVSLRRRGVGWLGFAPFSVYVVLFLGIPGVIAVASGFFNADGALSLTNFSAFADPNIQKDFWNSVWLSVISAGVSAILGALICWGLTAMRPDGTLRAVVDSASSVLAQFGGVMLAFAWIVTIGPQALVTNVIHTLLHVDINGNGPFLYTVGGLIFPYTYFGVPLMVLTFMPALEGLKPQWGEAVATLGGTRRAYWTRVGMPILAPA